MSDFEAHWFGGSPPAGFKIGTYVDSGTGLSTGGDQVNIFNSGGTRVTGVAFGSSTSGRTFDNTAALGSATAPLPTISTLSTAGVNAAVTVGGETGSPGVATVPTPVFVSEVAPWGSSDSTYGADWWELTNNSGQTLDLSGWKVDDESNSFAAAVALSGVSEPGAGAVGDLHRGRRREGERLQNLLVRLQRPGRVSDRHLLRLGCRSWLRRRPGKHFQRRRQPPDRG